MSSIFSKIVSGEIPCHKIAENSDFLAFLDINPLRKGHTLVIPKKETNYIFDMQDQELGELMVFAKSVAKKMEKVLPCERIGITVIGLEVPHTHIHLIPIFGVADMNFAQEKMSLSSEEMTEIAEKIRTAN